MAAFLGIDMEEWDKVDSVNVNLFGWWKEMKYKGEMVEVEELRGKTIMEIAYEEFDIYYHYMRE